MELALYDPAEGYYSSGRAAIGRGGDYFTSVSVGPLFGRLLAAHFAEMWEILGRPREFRIVEQGAHAGDFARDALGAAATGHPEFFAAVRYTIVEPFSILQARQATALAEFTGRVKWQKTLAEVPPFCGVHFSNELLDAMPVHLVRWNGTSWSERHVAEHAGGFALVDLPLSDRRLAERLALLGSAFRAGYETEIHLAALDWMRSVAKKLERGFIVIADYGFARDEYYSPYRTGGTLRGYARHRSTKSPLEEIGEADITAQVEWTSLAETAEGAGLHLAGFTDQHHFITGLLSTRLGEQLVASADAKTARALQTLLHPAQLGMKFQFLVLQKSVSAALSGLRFARDPRAALALSR
ncbi:MAG: class I SAM-dependent methyltransferase [Chthoniobacterales bacterium]